MHVRKSLLVFKVKPAFFKFPTVLKHFFTGEILELESVYFFCNLQELLH